MKLCILCSALDHGAWRLEYRRQSETLNPKPLNPIKSRALDKPSYLQSRPLARIADGGGEEHRLPQAEGIHLVLQKGDYKREQDSRPYSIYRKGSMKTLSKPTLFADHPKIELQVRERVLDAFWVSGQRRTWRGLKPQALESRSLAGGDTESAAFRRTWELGFRGLGV